MSLKYFIDCHCHMFTVADLPLFRTTYALSKRPKLPIKLLVPFFSLLLPVIDLPERVQALQKFMTFFENEPREACKQIVDELSALTSLREEGRFSPEKAVLVPLIMDFYDPDTALPKGDRLVSQATRLRDAIMTTERDDILILPFLGIDPRRGIAEIIRLLDSLVLGMHQLNVRSIVERENGLHSGGELGNVVNGDFIGIKLYPPLGFDVFPQEPLSQASTLAVYQLFNERRLPITVHCQPHGLDLVDNSREVGDPQKWLKVLEKIPDLRINFAHFGGEEGVKELIPFEERPPEGPDLNGRVRQYKGVPKQNTWTGRIVQMLRRYDNTYADLSAFDFRNDEAVAALHWILYHDLNGDFDHLGKNSILSKLLWGSDYPMPLKRRGGNSTCYSNLVEECAAAMTFTDPRGLHDFPNFMLVCDPASTRQSFLRRLMCDNPQRFLGLY